MTEKNHEAAFIPCGDSMEKMEDIKKDEINEEELEAVSGGAGRVFTLNICPKCGGNMLTIDDTVDGKRLTFYKCVKCPYKEPA